MNIVAGLLHLGQAAAILLLSNGFTLPVNTSFLAYVWETGSYGPAAERLGNLAIGPAVAVLLCISATAHLLLSLPGIHGWYVRNLERGVNYVRWYDYALGASLMIVLIAMLCGIYDLVTLLMMFALTAAMNMCGLVMELHNRDREKPEWASYYVGAASGLLPWLGIVIYFFGAVASSRDAVPSYVFFIIPSLFLFFFSFAVNMILQYEKLGPWRDYLYGEKVFIILSLLAKSALAWQIFAGTLRPV
jgi:hypothetical protein